MGGPIVRTGATPEFSAGWDKIFGARSKSTKAAKAKKSASKSTKKSARKKK